VTTQGRLKMRLGHRPCRVPHRLSIGERTSLSVMVFSIGRRGCFTSLLGHYPSLWHTQFTPFVGKMSFALDEAKNLMKLSAAARCHMNVLLVVVNLELKS
jgi:hypothetical protein